MQIPLVIITGYLGSGKTTFLKNILEQHSRSQNIGIIQNEFAPGDVDGKDLQRTLLPFKLMSINRGSVFCACLISDFHKLLLKFIEEEKPDVLFLEATGLADPINLGEIVQHQNLVNRVFLNSTWCIIDSSMFLKMIHSTTRMKHQIQVADQIILNKTDKVSKEEIEEVKSSIVKINPFARVHTSTYCDISISMDKLKKSGQTDHGSQFFSIASQNNRPNIFTYFIKSGKKGTLQNMISFLQDNTSKLMRVKGVLVTQNGILYVQSCFGDLSYENIDGYCGNTELIVMGEENDVRSFSGKYNKLIK